MRAVRVSEGDGVFFSSCVKDIWRFLLSPLHWPILAMQIPEGSI